jgi:hypothetical protein
MPYLMLALLIVGLVAIGAANYRNICRTAQTLLDLYEHD